METMATTKTREQDILDALPVSKIRRRAAEPLSRAEPLDDPLTLAEQRLESARTSLDAARRKYYEAKSVVSQLRRQTMHPVEAAINDLGRQRYRQFVRLVLRFLDDGTDFSEALRRAVTDLYPSRRSPQAVSRMAERLCRHPEIRAALDVALEGSEFSMQDAVRAHVQRIEAGEYRALRDYYKLVGWL
jgi:hypothetical protein